MDIAPSSLRGSGSSRRSERGKRKRPSVNTARGPACSAPSLGRPCRMHVFGASLNADIEQAENPFQERTIAFRPPG